MLAATALVVANMIGTGVFTSTGFMVPNLASGPILINWLIGGVLALCGAAAYAELGAMMPRVGGEYVYIKEAYHPALGFLSGWISLIVGFSAPIAASSIAFGAYLNAVTPVVPGQIAAVSLIIALTALHMIDLVLGSRVQTGFTILKVLLVVGFIVAGLSIGDGDWSHLDNPLPSASSSIFQEPFFVSLVYVSFSYSGWNAAAYVAGEIRDPGRILPRALILGTAIVTVLYIGLNVVFLYAAPAEALAGKEEIGAIAAVHLFGAEAGQWLSTCIALALVSSVSAMVMAGPRVYTAMAEDRLFFHFLAARNVRGAPVYSVLLQGLMAILFTVLVPFETLLQYIGFTLSIFAALAVTAVFILRARFPDAPRPYRTWGWPVSPLLFIALSVWMVVHLVSAKPVPTLFGGGATVASGLLVYFLWQRLTGRD
ncbi:MAG: amino acid permease [Haliangiales bacterium]